MNVKQIFESMEYGPAPESGQNADEWLDSHGRKFDLFIKGTWQKPESGAYVKSVNPANKKTLAQVAAANEADVNSAVNAASAALDGWRKLGGHSRARYM